MIKISSNEMRPEPVAAGPFPDYPFYTIFNSFRRITQHVKYPTFDQIIEADLVVLQLQDEPSKVVKNRWGRDDPAPIEFSFCSCAKGSP